MMLELGYAKDRSTGCNELKEENNVKRTLAIISAFTLLAMPVLGTGTVQARPQHAGVTLTVWDDFSAPTEAALSQLAKKWAATNGNTVTFVNTTQPGRGGKAIGDLFPLKARDAAGPDVIYVPQDQTGQFAASGLLAPRPANLLSTGDQALFTP